MEGIGLDSIGTFFYFVISGIVLSVASALVEFAWNRQHQFYKLY